MVALSPFFSTEVRGREKYKKTTLAIFFRGKKAFPARREIKERDRFAQKGGKKGVSLPLHLRKYVEAGRRRFFPPFSAWGKNNKGGVLK